METMTEGAMPGNDGPPGAAARAREMRVVMLNPRTFVLVPADEADPAPGDAPGNDPVILGEAQRVDLEAAPPDVTRESAEEPAVAAEMEGGPADLMTDDAPPAAPDPEPGDAPEASAPSPAAGADDAWKAALLARLDDLGRALAALSPPAAQPRPAQADPAAALARLDQRLTAEVSRIDARLEWLDGVLEEMAQDSPVPGGTDPDGNAPSGSLAEAVADLRMQLRMIEAQVGTLGKILVAVTGGDGATPEAMRTWLAERVAIEQRLAAGT